MPAASLYDDVGFALFHELHPKFKYGAVCTVPKDLAARVSIFGLTLKS